MQELSSLPGVSTIDFDQCPYGSETAKPTRVLYFRVDLSCLRAKCNHQPKQWTWHNWIGKQVIPTDRTPLSQGAYGRAGNPRPRPPPPTQRLSTHPWLTLSPHRGARTALHPRDPAFRAPEALTAR